MRSSGYKGLIAAAWTVMLLSGCCHDNATQCTTVHELYIRVASPANYAGDAMPNPEVDTATVFIFDNRGILCDMVSLDLDDLRSERPVVIEYTGTGRPRAVVWGNLKNSELTATDPGTTPIDEIRIKMPEGESYAAVPDNLYYAATQLTLARRQYITIVPAMGRLTITARGLAREEGENYFFRVETRVEGYDFYRASLPGERSLRVVAARGGAEDDLTIGEPLPMFVYPADNSGLEPIKVSLYKVKGGREELVGPTKIDDASLDIIPQAGRRVNVLMDFGIADDVQVVVRITDWDVVELWEEW